MIFGFQEVAVVQRVGEDIPRLARVSEVVQQAGFLQAGGKEDLGILVVSILNRKPQLRTALCEFIIKSRRTEIIKSRRVEI